MDLVSVAKYYYGKMKALLLLLFLIPGSQEDYEPGVYDRLSDIVRKYQDKTKGNPEFIAWIEDVDRIKNSGSHTSMATTLRDFLAFDKQRMQLEEEILIRINELDSLFADRRLSEACVDVYLEQKQALIKFKKMSNNEKKEALRKNSSKCTLVDTTQKPTPTKTTLITTSTAPGVNMTLMNTTSAPGENMTLTTTTTDPGVNMTLISASTEPEVTVMLAGFNTDPGKTSTVSGETNTYSGETSTDPGVTSISVSKSTDPWTNFPTRIDSPYVPIIKHC